MSAAVELPAAEAAPAPARGSARLALGVTIVLLLGLAALLAAAVLTGGGSDDGSIFPLGVGAAALAAAGACAALAGLVPRPRAGAAGVVCIVLLALLVLWSAASIVWSIAPDRSWAEANRELAYLAFLCLGVGAGTLVRRAPSFVAVLLGVLVAAALVWSLTAKVFPSLDEDGGRIARLRVPVEYWNALALLFVLGLPIALWLAGERRLPRPVRALAVVFLYGLVVASLLTLSRGGILVGIVALVVWLVLARQHWLESIAALAIALPLAGGAFAFALSRPGVVDDGQGLARRATDGHLFGIVLLAGAVVAFGIALAATLLEARHPVSVDARGRIGKRARLVLAAVAAAGAVVLGVRGEDFAGWVERQADEFANPPTILVTQEVERLVSVSSNNRWIWWNEAWDAFTTSPLEGNGAGSFATVHQLLRQDSLTVTEPHNAVLQFLSDTGVVGALLASGAALAALVAAAAALRRVREEERLAALALAIGVLAYVLHSLVDFDWQYVAITAPVLVAAGTLMATARPRARRRGDVALAAVAVAAVAVTVVSLGAPWLAERKVSDSYDALADGRPEQALAAADDARSLDPLSLEPLVAEASAHTALGEVEAARAALIRAVELQPLDADVWYELGAFELRVAERPDAARRYLERAQELDPFGPAQALLDQLA